MKTSLFAAFAMCLMLAVVVKAVDSYELRDVRDPVRLADKLNADFATVISTSDAERVSVLETDLATTTGRVAVLEASKIVVTGQVAALQAVDIVTTGRVAALEATITNIPAASIKSGNIGVARLTNALGGTPTVVAITNVVGDVTNVFNVLTVP